MNQRGAGLADGMNGRVTSGSSAGGLSCAPASRNLSQNWARRNWGRLTSRGGAPLAGSHEELVCRIASCRATSLVPLPARRGSRSGRQPGIRVGGGWYCSSACFEAGTESLLLDLSFAGRPLTPQARGRDLERMPLNLLLIARGWLTHSQSLAALEEYRSMGGTIEDAILRLGYASEQQITAARATQAGYPVYSLPERERTAPSQPALSSVREMAAMRSEALSGCSISALDTQYDSNPQAGVLSPALPPGSFGISIPRALTEQYSMLPLHYAPASRRLLLGFVKRVDHGLLYAIEKMADCTTEPCFLTPRDLEEGLSRRKSRPGNEEFRFDRPGRASGMAKIVRSYAVESEADEVRFGKARDYLWARLQSPRREIDLLFRYAG
ncbi:MAG TPA: hypothetical protein VGD59_08640 [Acidisarcina sp.]